MHLQGNETEALEGFATLGRLTLAIPTTVTDSEEGEYISNRRASKRLRSTYAPLFTKIRGHAIVAENCERDGHPETLQWMTQPRGASKIGGSINCAGKCISGVGGRISGGGCQRSTAPSSGLHPRVPAGISVAANASEPPADSKLQVPSLSSPSSSAGAPKEPLVQVPSKQRQRKNSATSRNGVAMCVSKTFCKRKRRRTRADAVASGASGARRSRLAEGAPQESPPALAAAPSAVTAGGGDKARPCGRAEAQARAGGTGGGRRSDSAGRRCCGAARAREVMRWHLYPSPLSFILY
jgi:hypothetical protein